MEEGPYVLTGFSSLVRDMSMLSELPSLSELPLVLWTQGQERQIRTECGGTHSEAGRSL